MTHSPSRKLFKLNVSENYLQMVAFTSLIIPA